MRYLEFSSATVRIFTGSIGHYLGNYWFSYRFYLTPKPGQTNFSSAFYIRRYLSGTENYVTLRLGVGLVSYSEIQDQQFSGFSSKGAAFDFQFNVTKLTFLRSEIEYGNIEYYKGKYRDSYGIKIGIQQRF
jgi:YaiO family outer membrane protein